MERMKVFRLVATVILVASFVTTSVVAQAAPTTGEIDDLTTFEHVTYEATMPDGPSPETGFESIADHLLIVYVWRTATQSWDMYWPQAGIDTIEALEVGSAYWVLVDSDCTLAYGTVSTDLYAGWNNTAWLGYGKDEIVLYEHTKEISEQEAENIAELTEDRDKILFQELTDFVAGIQVGDVLMSGHPVPGAEHGFLKRVVGVQSLAGTLDEGGAIEIDVEPATLEDVIQQGAISVTQTIPLEDLLNDAVWATGVEVQQVQAGRRFSYTPADGVKIEGYLRVTADARVDIETHWWHGIQKFEFVFSPGLELEITLTVEQDVQWNRKYTLATITGPPIPIYGPVTITPTIELVVGTDGTIAAHLETTATYDRVYDVGIRYLRNEGWSTISNIHGEGFTLDGPHFTGSAEARVFAGAVLSGRTGVSYIAEATLGTELLGNIRASGSIETSPWHWQYDLELYLSAQVSADLELARIAGIGWESPIWQHPDPPHNLAYGASGRVTTEDEEGLEGIQINFSGDHSSVITDADGYWTRHLLSGEVTVTPKKDGYVFHPPSMSIAGSASDLNFQAFDKLDLIVTSTEGGSVTVTVDGAETVVGPGETETISDTPVGTEVDLEASPDSDYEFAEWQGEPIDGVTKPSTTITMNGRYSITATFQVDTLTVFEDGRLAAGGHHTVGLKNDGTAVAVGSNHFGQCGVGGWAGIVQVAAGYVFTAGLKSDGTVVTVGDNYWGQRNVGDWVNIVRVAAGSYHTVGLRNDGTVVAVGSNWNRQLNVGGWTNIVQVAAGTGHTVGLKSDGTVVAVGANRYGQLNVGSWTEIVQVAAGGYHTVGLRYDGTVVAVGRNDYGQCNVDVWTGMIWVASGFSHTLGLRSDGTVVAAGSNDFGQCNVGFWTGMIWVASGFSHTLGLRSDGTVVAVGRNWEGQCNVADWDLL